MKYDIIVWDFNGTLLCDMQAGIDSVNEMLSKRGLKTLAGVEEYRDIFCFPIIEYYRRVGFDFEKEDYYTVLAPEWIELYNKYSADSSLYPEVKETLERIAESDAMQVLLSATELGMLTKQIKDYGISEYFDIVLGLDNIHAHSKVALAMDLRGKYPEKSIVMIGDTPHDSEVARAIGADCILYSGGHSSEKNLVGCGATIIKNLSEIFDIVQ